ncbi:MAG: glycogen/starch/alpha-glucan phosphorylase [Bacteroidales bacterium]|nr:glycogen/starch/alpha-glucan phosphorylase [Bacteroidales bacterium]HOY40155.1 glycogen/starch/alpha-glucan phosphorylase [Bacteroidales bacterium]
MQNKADSSSETSLFSVNEEKLTPGALSGAITEKLFYHLGRRPHNASMNDFYLAVSITVRDRLMERALLTADNAFSQKNQKIVCYLSAEFLMGPQLGANLIDLGIEANMIKALKTFNISLEDVIAMEEEPGLGNGGLGRLASCYMDSLASVEIPAVGYGIRYEFGIFDQEIRDGWQVEVTDKWLKNGNPWEIPRPDFAVYVNMGGYTEHTTDTNGVLRVAWIPDNVIKGIPYDTPELGYKVQSCNFLRLWRSEAVESFDFSAFNHGDYFRAVNEKMLSENISKVLYPNDESSQGKELRLKQQYFFVSCSLQDMMRMHIEAGGNPAGFHKRYSVQLNDTHPSIAVAELMRLLIDTYELDWETAWQVTTSTMCYTNHTLLPEALEKWALELFQKLLPRHLEIIYEINHRFLMEVKQRFPGDICKLARLSIIDENKGKFVRMANLACAGSSSINGVAELHTRLLKTTVLPDWVDMYPDKFHNITNGVTPRRFIVLSNPGLTNLINDTIGNEWPSNLNELRKLENFITDTSFLNRWQTVKTENKKYLAKLIKSKTGVSVNPESMFDIHVKRIHEYKRQHLNILNILTRYIRIKSNTAINEAPRTYIFGGKAAPGYYMAKLMIKLINSVADLINNDTRINEFIKVVFYPDFNVTNAQPIYPAADLSEQISTAGKEASGTGNMKFAMNGALTIGTLDGANIEIREEVGHDNFFLFGLTAEQINETMKKGYDPSFIYRSNEELCEVIGIMESGLLSSGDKELFKPLVQTLVSYDTFMLLADYPLYVACQDYVNQVWSNKNLWATMSVRNVARIGKFSSDRSIREYCEKIWHVKPCSIQ